MSSTLLALAILCAPPAPITEPTVHDAAARLNEAQAAVYKKRALNLVLDSPVLLASSPRRPNAVVNDGWRIKHETGRVTPDDVAQQLHRSHELEAYDHAVGTTGIWVGLSMMAAAIVPGTVAGVMAGGDYQTRNVSTTVGGIAGVTAGVGLITTLVSLAMHSASDSEVPIEAATKLVRDYNASIVDELTGASVAATTTMAVAALVANVEPVLAPVVPSAVTSSATAPFIKPVAAQSVVAPAAPMTDRARMGVVLIESDGVRVVRTEKQIALKKGDLIVAIDEVPIKNISVFEKYVALSRPGDVLTVRVRRAGKKLDLNVRI